MYFLKGCYKNIEYKCATPRFRWGRQQRCLIEILLPGSKKNVCLKKIIGRLAYGYLLAKNKNRRFNCP